MKRQPVGKKAAPEALIFGAAMFLALTSQGSWATAMFDASATAQYQVTQSGLDVSIFYIGPGTSTGGKIGNASFNTVEDATGTISGGTLQAQADGTASAPPNSKAFAVTSAQVNLDVGNLGASSGEFTFEIDWDWMTTVAAGLPGELARVGVSLEVIAFNSTDNVIEDQIFLLNEFFTTAVGDSGLYSGSSGVQPFSRSWQIPGGDTWFFDIFLNIDEDPLAQSAVQQAPLPSALALLGLGVVILGFVRKRV